MVWSRDHSPRFSYVRDGRPRGVFSYSPFSWRSPSRRQPERSSKARAEGEDAARKEMMMYGGAALGVVAVGALVWMAAKK